MKLQFIATAQSPNHYDINGEVITAYSGDQSESIDLSVIEEGGKFQGIELSVLDLPPMQVIRDCERKDGELHVTLCQEAGSGHWRKSDWMDAANYDPETTYIKNIE